MVLLAGRPAALAGTWTVPGRPRDRGAVVLLEIAEAIRAQLARSMPAPDASSLVYEI